MAAGPSGALRRRQRGSKAHPWRKIALPALVLLLLVPAVSMVAMIAEGAGGGPLSGGAGGAPGSGPGAQPGEGANDPDGGNGGAGDALRELVERFTTALSMAAEARDRALAELGQAMASLNPRDAADLRDALQDAAERHERGSRTLEEVEAAFREAERIDPDRLEQALRAGVLVSDVELMGDPVHPSSGALHHQEREFALPIGDTFFDLSRLHRSDLSLGESFGTAWFAPFESFAFYSLPQELALDETTLVSVRDQIGSAIKNLEATAFRRFGGVAASTIDRYYRDLASSVDRALSAGDEAVSLSESARSVVPPFQNGEAADTLLAESKALLAEASVLVVRYEADRNNARELLRLLPRLRGRRQEIEEALGKAALHREFLRWSDRRSREALSRNVPDGWRGIGLGVIGVVDERGTLLLYRAARGASGESLDPAGFVMPGITTPLGKQTDTLTMLPDGELIRVRRDGTAFRYDQEGRLLSRKDRNGQGYILSRGEQRILVEGSYGRKISLELAREAGHERVSAVRAPNGALWRYAYGPGGELAEMEKPDGAIYRYRYTRSGGGAQTLTSVSKPDGSELSFFYDSRGRVRALADEEGERQEFLYGDRGGRFTLRDRRGGETSLILNERGLPLERITPLGAVRKFAYDEEGRLLRQEYSTGEREQWSYTAEGLLSRHYLPSGAVLRYEYDRRRRLRSITGGPQGTTRYRYDNTGNLVGMEGAWGRRSFQLDHAGRPVTMTDALGNRWQFRYGPYGNVTELIQPDGSRRGFSYDSMGRLRSITDEAGATTRFVYDSMGQLLEIEAPDGSVERREYDSRGDLTRLIAPDGGETRYEYDRRHRRIVERLPDGRVIRRQFDGEGSLLSETINGELWRAYTRDKGGRIVARHDPLLKGTTELSLDTRGRAIEARGPEGGITLFSYYADGSYRSITSPSGGVGRFHRDPWGRLMERIDPEGGRWSAVRDEAGRIVALRSPLGAEETYRYNAEGRLIVYTDHVGGEHRYLRDWRGRITRHRTPSGADWRYEYGATGRLEQLVSPEGRRRSFEHDAMGRLAAFREGAYEPRHFSYDPAGRLTGDRIGDARWRFEYDSAGRLRSVTDPDGVVRSYDYDVFDRLREVSFGAGAMRRRGESGKRERWEGLISYQLSLDRRGLIAEYTDPDGVSFRYNYSPSGLLAEIRSSGERVLAVHRDLDGRPIRLLHDDGGRETRRYDLQGRLVEAEHSSGVKKRFRYDAAGRLVELQLGDAPPVSRRYSGEGYLLEESVAGAWTRRFRYDRDGLLLEASAPGETRRYRYDDRGRLRSVEYGGGGTVRIELEHDEWGGVVGYTVPSLDVSVRRDLTPAGRVRSISVNGAEVLRLEYDESGREVSRVVPNAGAQRTFYDGEGRVAAAVWQSEGRVAAVGAAYEYTEAGRLSGELHSDGTGKFYRYRSDGLLDSTVLLLPEELSVPYTPYASHHQSYSSLRRRLRELLPTQPRALLSRRSYVERSPAGEPYAYGYKHSPGDPSPGEVLRDHFGQTQVIALPSGEMSFTEDPLRRLGSVRLLGHRGEERRSFFYPGPEALYPLLSHTTVTSREEVEVAPVHRHRGGEVASVDRFGPAVGTQPRRTAQFSQPSREQWTLVIPGSQFPALYLPIPEKEADASYGEGSANLFGLVRDLRGSPLWRFDVHRGITQKWLYSGSGSSIMGKVDNEAALGFAAGTNAGPLLRLGYRFYDPAAGHFTMADPSGRDLHPTRYAGGDPVNFVDPWGLEQYNMMGFDRQNERLYVQVWDDRRPNRPIRVLNYGATNRVRTPAERGFVPVGYDPDPSVKGDDYHYFPERFPASPPEGWRVHSPYNSSNPGVGPAIRTDASRIVDTYTRDSQFGTTWERSGNRLDEGYYLHGGVGSTTWGCIRMADGDLLETQELVQQAARRSGYSRLHTIDGSNPR